MLGFGGPGAGQEIDLVERALGTHQLEDLLGRDAIEGAVLEHVRDELALGGADPRSRRINGSVSFPSRRSERTGLPTSSSVAVKSSRSSTSWKQVPSLRP